MKIQNSVTFDSGSKNKTQKQPSFKMKFDKKALEIIPPSLREDFLALSTQDLTLHMEGTIDKVEKSWKTFYNFNVKYVVTDAKHPVDYRDVMRGFVPVGSFKANKKNEILPFKEFLTFCQKDNGEDLQRKVSIAFIDERTRLGRIQYKEESGYGQFYDDVLAKLNDLNWGFPTSRKATRT